MSTENPDRQPGDHEDHGVIQLHEPIARELEEPREGFEAPPMWWVFGVMMLLGWGGWYLGTYSGNYRADVYDERPGVAMSAPAAPASIDPMVVGKRVFANCQACHQPSGVGVPGTYPPLVGSEWVVGAPETLVRILLHGAQGSFAVKGQTYNQAMPAWKHLTDEQLAAVTSYVRGSWGNGASPVPAALVKTVREAAADRTQPWTMAELKHLAAVQVTEGVPPQPVGVAKL